MSSLLSEDAKPNANSYVLDASAVLAVILREPGGERVREAIRSGSLLNAVNLAEVGAKLLDFGFSQGDITSELISLSIPVVPFDGSQAWDAGLLRPVTSRLGLSLGDRACLASAIHLEMPILTADRIWATLDIGVEVVLCR